MSLLILPALLYKQPWLYSVRTEVDDCQLTYLLGSYWIIANSVDALCAFLRHYTQ